MFKYCPRCSNLLGFLKKDGKTVSFCGKCNKPIYQHTPQTSACILLNKNGEILLVKRKNEPFKKLWSLPAGFVEYGENPIDAGLRELKEETNIEAEYDHVVGIYLVDEHSKTYSILTVIMVKNAKGKLTSSDDVTDCKYFDPKKLPQMAFKAQVKAIEDYLMSPSAMILGFFDHDDAGKTIDDKINLV